MDLSCGGCRGSVRDAEIRCGGFCGKCFHMKCVGFSKYERDALFKYPNVKYICDGCINFIGSTNENYKNLLNIVMENENKMTAEINKTTNLLEQRVKEAKNEIVNELLKINQGEETYASKVKSKNVPVILKPKNKQSSDLTAKEVKEKIKPSALNMQVKRIMKRNEGIVTINCESENDRNVLTNEIKKKWAMNTRCALPGCEIPKY